MDNQQHEDTQEGDVSAQSLPTDSSSSSPATDSSSVDGTSLSTNTGPQDASGTTPEVPGDVDGATAKPPGETSNVVAKPATDVNSFTAQVPGNANGVVTKPPEQLEAQAGVSAASDQEVGSDQSVHAENERLRKEVAHLRAQQERRQHPGRARRTLVGVLVFLSCLGILTSTLTVWSSSTLLSTTTWLQIVGPIGQNSQVIQSVSSYTAGQVVMLLDVQARAQQALPPKATFLAAPLTQAVQSFIQGRVTTLMHRPAFQELWINTNRYVYTQLLAALRGQTSTLHISNGVVTLNLIPVIDQALMDIQQHLPTLIAQHVTLPDPSQLQVPQQAQQKLSQALGVQVPSNLGQIQLYSSAQLAKAQQLLRLWDVLTWVLPLVTAMLLILTLWLSRDRRRTLVELGIGIAIGFILVKIAIGYLQQYIINSTMNPTAKSVVQPTLQTVFGGLDGITTWLLVGGVVLAVVAFLVGKPEWFRAAYAWLRSAYHWVAEKFQDMRHRPPQPAAGAA